MPPLDNPRHEAFCHLLLAGLTATDAYEKAGYKRDDGAASRLSGDVRIRGRLKELQHRAADAVTIDKAWVLRQLIETFNHARGLGQISAAVGALKLLGIEAGMLSERHQAEVSRNFVIETTPEDPDSERWASKYGK